MKAWGISAAVLALACATGCRTVKEVMDDYEVAITTGDYAKPIAETSELAGESGDTQLLWQLLAGSAMYMADDKAGARQMFDAAEASFARNDTTSVFAQGAEGAFAMMTNDRVFSYDGGGQDRIFTCLYKSIDMMASGDVAGARVELNRASRYQANWLYDRRRDVDAAAKKMEADANAYAKREKTASQGNRSQHVAKAMRDSSFGASIRAKCNFDPATSGDLSILAPKDYMNVYATHLTGVFRWLNGDGDMNHLRDAAALAPGCAVAVRDYQEQTRGGRPSNQVWIYVEDGLCPCREEWRLDLPLILIPYLNRYIMYAGMALPYLRYRTQGAISWSVQTPVGIVQMEQLANVDALMKTEYDVYMRGALAREITRVIVKASVQVALGVTAENVSDDYTKIALKASQIGAAAWAASVTAADMRSWTALPKTVKVARVDRPDNGHLEVVADAQRIQLDIPAGNAIVFIRKPGPSAMPVVKVATFR